ncbi:MAG: chemotaxis protein CheX [Spirochaetaceae bacterium]|jgi:chemotaxis protein CheX|nr:chemotaxis protein CheX [Spirochaetaceae bacterium]
MEKYIQAFIDVAHNVFKEMLNTDIEAQRPYFTDRHANSNWDISGVIGLTGEVSGAFVISMEKNLAVKFIQILTGSDSDYFSDDDVADGIGEIANIIAGNVKQNLEQECRLVISLPTVICGTGHTIQWPHGNTNIICIPFKIFHKSIFYLSVAIKARGSTVNV